MTPNDDYLWDGSGSEDPEVRRLETLLGRYRQAPASPPPRRHEGLIEILTMMPLAAAACWLIAVFGGAERPGEPVIAWHVAPLAGAPRLDETAVHGVVTTGEGHAIVTDDTSAALIEVNQHGCVQMAPNSRLRLVRTRPSDQRLSLTHGTIHAVGLTTPRVFAIETPSATIIDLGSAYTLTVDASGRSHLCVNSGWVAVRHAGREMRVPSGAVCETRPGEAPGTPYFGGASDAFRAALARFDFEGGHVADLETVLRESNMCEVFTLWQLLPRVAKANRGLVYDRMAQLLPPPPGVTREGVLALDQSMLDVWGSQFARSEFIPCLASCTVSSVDARPPVGPAART
ncbi:MAG TPA: FecR domain-containing protein [bacterium]|nr:FecR domain-containing protein [bacterium]